MATSGGAIFTVTPLTWDKTKLSMSRGGTGAKSPKVSSGLGKLCYDGREKWQVQVRAVVGRGAAWYDQNKAPPPNARQGRKNGGYVACPDPSTVPQSIKSIKVWVQLRGARVAFNDPKNATDDDNYTLKVVQMINDVEDFVYENGGRDLLIAENPLVPAAMYASREPWMWSMLRGEPLTGPMTWVNPETGKESISSLTLSYGLWLNKVRPIGAPAVVESSSCFQIESWVCDDSGKRLRPVASKTPGSYFDNYVPGVTVYDFFTFGVPKTAGGKVCVGATPRMTLYDPSTAYGDRAATADAVVDDAAIEW